MSAGLVKVHRGAHPILAKLATCYLGTPATTVPCERIFSKSGLIVNKTGDALSPATTGWTCNNCRPERNCTDRLRYDCFSLERNDVLWLVIDIHCQFFLRLISRLTKIKIFNHEINRD